MTAQRKEGDEGARRQVKRAALSSIGRLHIFRLTVGPFAVLVLITDGVGTLPSIRSGALGPEASDAGWRPLLPAHRVSRIRHIGTDVARSPARRRNPPRAPRPRPWTWSAPPSSSTISCSTTGPPGWLCSAAAGKLFIFGGNNGSVRLQDLYSLDTQTMAWKREVCSGSVPAPRAGHTMTLLPAESAAEDDNPQLLCFAGGDIDEVW